MGKGQDLHLAGGQSPCTWVLLHTDSCAALKVSDSRKQNLCQKWQGRLLVGEIGPRDSQYLVLSMQKRFG